MSNYCPFYRNSDEGGKQREYARNTSDLHPPMLASEAHGKARQAIEQAGLDHEEILFSFCQAYIADLKKRGIAESIKKDQQVKQFLEYMRICQEAFKDQGFDHQLDTVEELLSQMEV